MKKIFFYINLILLVSLLTVSCEKKQEDLPIIEKSGIDPVSQFIYDGMSTYYFWADEVTAKKPTKEDKDPEVYFSSLINTLDKKNSWSFITDDVESLLSDFSGEPKDFGFSVTFAAANEAGTEYFAIIQYVFPETPASNAGLKRLDVIGKINGQVITSSNYMTLYGNQTATFSMYKITDSGLVADREVTMTPTVNKTNPVLYKNVYEINGKKIAYLFYTGFISEYNNSLFSAFEEFKLAGATDVVLDIRYNRGGSLGAASYLGSLLAPKSVVQSKSPFVVMTYNKFINEYFDTNGGNRTYSLGNFSITSESNPLNANLDLSNVYIIATGGSASASELITFCLRPYTNVVHIGGKTSGKYTASWTLHPYNDYGGGVVNIYEENKLSANDIKKLKNWAMQPIVGMYANHKGENFSNPGYLQPNYELKEGGGYVNNWKPIGDLTDTFLGQAIYLITGDETYKPKAQNVLPMGKIKVDEKIDQLMNRSLKEVSNQTLVIDDIKLSPKDFEEIKLLKEKM